MIGYRIQKVIVLKIEYTTFSEAGRRRDNQDVCRVVKMPEHNRVLMVVCDGMGGHSMGGVAAEIVCNAICEYWNNNTETPDTETKVIEACKVAYDALDTPSRICHIMMGTTMVMASVEGNIITIAIVGTAAVTYCVMERLFVRLRTTQILIVGLSR